MQPLSSDFRTIKHQGAPILAENRLKLANEFVNNGNAIAALNLLDPMETFEYGGYDEVLDLFKKIIEEEIKHPQNGSVPDCILKLVNGIPDNKEKFDVLISLLSEFAKLGYHGAQEAAYKQCLSIASEISERNMRYLALRELADALFAIESYEAALEIIDEAITCAKSGPDYNKFTMAYGYKKEAELEGVSRSLTDTAIELTKNGREKLARQVADKIPIENLKSYAMYEISRLANK